MSLTSKMLKKYGLEGEKPNEQNPPDMPQNFFRWIVAGQTGSGKTTLITEAVLTGQLKFYKLYLYTKNPFEDKYLMLANHYADLAEKMGVPINEIFEVGRGIEDIVAVDDLNKEIDNLIIFDDFMADKLANETIILEHFLRGRKAHASYIYLTQSYFRVPKDVRLQADYATVFRYKNKVEINAIKQRVANDIDEETFLREYKEATDKPHGSYFIDQRID